MARAALLIIVRGAAPVTGVTTSVLVIAAVFVMTLSPAVIGTTITGKVSVIDSPREIVTLLAIMGKLKGEVASTAWACGGLSVTEPVKMRLLSKVSEMIDSVAAAPEQFLIAMV